MTALELPQWHLYQRVRAATLPWITSCYLRGVRSEHGFTLFEIMIALAIAGIMAAIAVPVFSESSARNAVWAGSEMIGSQIRQARLMAISRNTSFQVRFDCPAAGQFRVLVVDGTINDANRCNTTLEFDSGVFAMPPAVGFNSGGAAVPALEVNGRGIFTSPGAIPQTITVTYGLRSRSLTVRTTGQITFEVF